MQADHITQGSIIYGIRSCKYPAVRCYGVVISARCDVANCKVQKLYYLVAVNAREWFLSQTGYELAYAEKIKSNGDKLKNEAAKHSLDFAALSSFTEQEFERVIESQDITRKEKKSISEAYSALRAFSCPSMTTEKRRMAIEQCTKPVINCLNDLTKGRFDHFAFLPESSFRDTDTKDDGIIVDLQEIGILAMEDAERIQSSGIDYLYLEGIPKEDRLRVEKDYWLEAENDFVMSADTISSPWIEYLMQRFSHAFIKVGVDGASSNDFSDLAAKIWKRRCANGFFTV